MSRLSPAWRLCLVFCLLCLGDTLCADEARFEFDESGGWKLDGWILQTSFYTRHFNPDPEHINDQELIGVEAIFENEWLIGAAAFDNSFGQNSQFVYAGRTWQILHSRFWYVKLMGGLLHGYKEPYEDKIPFNGLGIAPAIVPALGFKYKHFVSEASIGGLAVVTFTAGVRF